jgi:hypothetical protein
MIDYSPVEVKTPGEYKPIAQKITGYRDLSRDEIAFINAVKEAGDHVGVIVGQVQASTTADQRWAAIAKTQLQEGFMALVRAVAQPTSF